MPEPKEIQVVILMGGLGTRLGYMTKKCPKAMMDVKGEPFFNYQLRILKLAGFCKFVFLVGYHADMIENYYQDGNSFGVSIQYSYDGRTLLGTGGAVRRAYDILEDDFLLLYGDSFMDIDFRETIYRYYWGKQQGNRALMTILENRNHLDKNNVLFQHGKIILYDKVHPQDEMDHIDYGVSMFEKELFLEYLPTQFFDISLVQNQLSKEGKLTAHEVMNRFYEIGSPESLEEFREYSNRRFGDFRKAVFFDRDGVINEIVFREETEQLDSPLAIDEVILKKDIIEAMKLFQKWGYYLFVVTNQPAAAKGKTSLRSIYDVNTEVCKLLRKEEIYIDGMEICPHYPKAGHNTKESFLIRDCNCRKPKTGMLDAIFRKFRIDRENSWMVGDSYTDVIAGRNAGLKTAFLGSYKCDVCKCLNGNKPDLICEDLMGLIRHIQEIEDEKIY